MITQFYLIIIFWEQHTLSRSTLRSKRRPEFNSINYSDLTNQDIVCPLPICVFKMANRKSGSLYFCFINGRNRRWVAHGPATKTTIFAAQRRLKRCRRSGWGKNSFCNVFLYEIRIRKQEVTKIQRRRINRRRSPSCLRPGLSYA